jgi:hypothetical protein
MRFLRLRHIVALHHLPPYGVLLLLLVLAWPGPTRVLFLAPLRSTAGACLGLFGLAAPGVLP